MQYCKELVQTKSYEFMVFGHRHLPLDMELGSENKSQRYLNLGDWITHFTYGVFDGEEMKIEKYSG